MPSLLSGSGGGGSGGYKGDWTAGTYAAGSIVRRGPFLFACQASTAIDPMDVSNVGSAADWDLIHSGAGLQYGNIARFTNNGVAQNGTIYRKVTMATWDRKRIVADILTGASGQADGIAFGFHNSAVTPVGSDPRGTVSLYGVYIDIWNNQVSTILNGVQGNNVAVTNAGQITGNEILETTRFYRYYCDFVESGANWIITLYRSHYDLNTAAGGERPGFLATWTVTKPPFTTCRLYCGGVTGGVAGTHKARSVFCMDRSGAWDIAAVMPHTPRIDHAAFDNV